MLAWFLSTVGVGLIVLGFVVALVYSALAVGSFDLVVLAIVVGLVLVGSVLFFVATRLWGWFQ